MSILSRLQIVSLCAAFAASVSIYAQPGGGSVKLEPVKQLRKGVDLWPLIANPSSAAEQRINSALANLNGVLASSVRDCDSNYRDWARDVHQSLTGKNAVIYDWQRSVTVTMTGPHFLGLVARDDYVFCGGAHPDSDSMAMVFDLDTGKPVNWMHLIASSAKASPFADSVIDGSHMGALIVTALVEKSRAQAVPDCKDAFQDDQSYQLWPDARTGTLVVEPFGLPHVVAACAEDLSLSLDQARKFGFDESLLKAIDQAHRAGSALSQTGKQ